MDGKRVLTVIPAVIALAIVLTTAGTGKSDVATATAVPSTVAPAASAGPSTTASTTTASTTITTTATTTPTTPAPDPLLGSGQAVTIAFAGDTNFESGMDTRLAHSAATAIGPFTPILSSADLAIGNLETSVGTHGTPEVKDFTFQAPPEAIDAMRAGGFDAVSMANNHGRDFGPDGLVDSLAVRDAQPDHFVIGIGHDDTDAYSPFRATVKGQRIAVIGATQVLDAELITAWTAAPGHPGLASAKEEAKLVAAVKAARADSDTVVVFLHWGTEKMTCPTGVQQSLARKLADAGADIVIGSHAHRLEGAGFLGQTFVGYGLGNFDFYANGADAAKTGVVKVTVTGRRVDAYELVPGHISGSVATPLTGAAADAATAEWEGLRDCTGLTSTRAS